jgi:hypothetical protein
LQSTPSMSKSTAETFPHAPVTTSVCDEEDTGAEAATTSRRPLRGSRGAVAARERACGRRRARGGGAGEVVGYCREVTRGWKLLEGAICRAMVAIGDRELGSWEPGTLAVVVWGRVYVAARPRCTSGWISAAVLCCLWQTNCPGAVLRSLPAACGTQAELRGLIYSWA